HVQTVGKRELAVGNGQLLRRGRFRRERETRREEKSGRRERSPKLRNRHFTPLRTNSSVPHGILVWRLRVKRKPGRSATAPPRHPNRSRELYLGATLERRGASAAGLTYEPRTMMSSGVTASP